MSENTFLPGGYEAPKQAGFVKLKVGKNRFRIVTNVLPMWKVWLDSKPSNVEYKGPESKPATPTGGADPSKNKVTHSWAFGVYNYDTQAIELFELDKVSLQNLIKSYAENPKWGHPGGYDIIIERTGTTQTDTKYTLSVDPKEELSAEILDLVAANPMDLSQLFVNGGNVFIGTQAANPANANAQPQQTAAKVVTGENWVAGDPAPAGFTINPDGSGITKKKMPWE